MHLAVDSHFSATLGGIQNFILRTAEFAPARHLYAASYRWSLRAASRVLVRLRHVEAVLLRTSGPGYRFEPGLSDIDLTIIHSAEGHAETLEFLDEFWSTYRRLKKWLPMLGEVEILTADEFTLIARLAPQLAKVQKTYVAVSIAPSFAGKEGLEEAMRTEHVEPALPQVLAFVFTKFTTAIMPRLLAFRIEPTLVHRKRLDRQLTTASRTLADTLAGLGVDSFEPVAGPVMRRAAQFHGNLGRCSARLVSDTFGPQDPTITQQPVEVPAELERFAGAVFGDLHATILWSRPICFPHTMAMAIITEDDLEPLAFSSVVDGILRFRRELPQQFRLMLSGDPSLRHFRVDGFPFIMPRSTFRWFGELSPFYFPAFSLSERPSIGGALEMFAPSRATCVREALLHYRGFLSLKNNWQHSPTNEARRALYGATIDYVEGLTSVARGSRLTPPATHRHEPTLVEAYRELQQSLERLGQALNV